MRDNKVLQRQGIEEADTRAIVNMLAKIAAMEEPLTVKKRWLLENLGAYIGADKWLSALRVQKNTSDSPNFVGLLHGGFEPEQLAKLAESAAHPSVKAIDEPHAMEQTRRKTHLTLRLEDFDQQRLWPESPAGELARQAGVGTFLSSTRPLYDTGDDEIKSIVFVFYRSPGEPCFSERERRIAHIVLTEVKWLHTDGWPQEYIFEKTSDLSRRHLALLSLLVHGNSRQKISQLMQLSINTVNTYIKTIFHHFGVNSQTELMQYFIYGDGNDVMNTRAASPSLDN